MSEQVCMYCMQEMKAAQDPRRLLCGHVFCLSCLKAEKFSKALTSHQCASCRATYDDVKFDELPSVLIREENVVEVPTETHGLYCDRCNDNPAVKYCVDCGEKSCAHHMKHHDGYYENLHDTLDIQVYAQNPSCYVKVFTCKKHKNELITMACERCYQYNCVKCDTGEKSCSVWASVTVPVVKSSPVGKRTIQQSTQVKQSHFYCPLTKIRSSIKGGLQRTYDQLGTIDDMEKTAWMRIDKLVEKCKDMLAVVEVKAAEQLHFIRDQTKQLQQSIRLYETEKTNQVLTFVSELMKKKEEIIDVRRTTYKFLNNSHTLQLVEQKQEKMDALRRVSAIDLGSCNWSDKYLRIGKKRQIEIRLHAPVPGIAVSALTFAGHDWQK